MRRGFISILGAALCVSACNPMDVLFPEDPRLGTEAENICVGRVRAKMTYAEYQELETAPGLWVPSFLYDITNLDLEARQALIATGADETAGTRLIQQTSSTSAAVERFKLTVVDEKGALFVGRDPALYKVRGEPQGASTIITSGCARQQANMRLTQVFWSPYVPEPVSESEEEEGASTDTPSSELPDAEITDISNNGGVE